MTEVVRFEGPDGSALLVEVDDDAPGLERISRDREPGEVVRAGRRLEDALAHVRPALRSVVDTVRALGPDAYEVEFGVKFNAESGVVIAKSAVEGHFTVKVQWSRPARPAAAPDQAAASDRATAPVPAAAPERPAPDAAAAPGGTY